MFKGPQGMSLAGNAAAAAASATAAATTNAATVVVYSAMVKWSTTRIGNVKHTWSRFHSCRPP